MVWILTVKIHKVFRLQALKSLSCKEKKLFGKTHFGQIKMCVQIHWCEGSLGKSPVTLLHSFASQQCVSSYLFLPSVPIERGIR